MAAVVRLPVFVDTSAWYALLNARAGEHGNAAAVFDRLAAERRRLVTTNHVVAESYMLVLYRAGRATAQGFLGRIRTSPAVDRVFVTEAWADAAEELLARFDDQSLSYVDATSFVAMRHLGLLEAFAYDNHFATAGFTLVRE